MACVDFNIDFNHVYLVHNRESNEKRINPTVFFFHIQHWLIYVNRHRPKLCFEHLINGIQKHFFLILISTNDRQSLGWELHLRRPLHLHSSPSLYLSFPFTLFSYFSPSSISPVFPLIFCSHLPLSLSIYPSPSLPLSPLHSLSLSLSVLLFTQTVHSRCR